MKHHHILLCTALAAFAQPAFSAHLIVPVAGTYNYSQNFDTMFAPASAGAVATSAANGTNWADGVTVPDWFFHYTSNAPATPTGVFAGASFIHSGNDGSAAPTLTLNSMGVAGSTDRALGAPSTTARCEQSGIVVFQNTSSKAVEITRIRYNGEVLRTNSTANTVESIHTYFKVGDSEAALLTITTENLTAANAAIRYGATEASPTAGFYVTGWTEVLPAIFTYSHPSPATQVDELIAVDATGLSGIRVGPGKFFALRFSNPNGAGTDALLGIDDLSVEFAEVNASVTADVSNVVRDDNGTAGDPADDKVNFVLTVTGSGSVGPTWDVTSPPSIAGTGNAFGPKAINGVPIAEFSGPGHTLAGTVSDPANPGVTDNFTVTAPWATISVTASNFTRLPGLDAGTPADDDFLCDLNVTGLFTGPSWISAALPPLPPSGDYGVTVPSVPTLIPVLFDGTDGPIAQVGPVTISDSLDATAVTPNLYFLPPLIIGQSTVSGLPVDVVSNPALLTGDSSQVTWASDPVARRLQMTDGDRGGAGAGAKEITADVNLAGVAGPVVFSMRLTATDGSSGFEAPDTFAASLIYNDGMGNLPPVSLLTPAQDTNNDGILSGTEIVTANTVNVLEFNAIIPDNIQSARLVIRGMADSGFASERMDVTDILFALAPPSIFVSAASNVQRIENGPGAADDTVTFQATLAGVNASAGWTTATPGVSPASGNYGPATFTIAAPLPASPFDITFNDAGNPALTATIGLNIPARGIMAQRDFGGGPVDVALALGGEQSALWINDAAARTLTLNTGVNGQTETVAAEVLDLSTVGAVRFTGKLTASDTSVGSNFEVGDKFRAELVVDGGLPTEQIINPGAAFDTGNGTSAVPFLEGQPVPNGPADGWINGYTGTASAADGFAAATDEYDAHRARDEFNRNDQTAVDSMLAELTFTALIPASASSVQLRIQSQGIQGTETAVFQEALFSLEVGPPPIVPGNASLAINVGASGKVSAASIAGLATGGGGPLTVSAVQAGPTPRGGTVTLQDGWVVYEPAPGSSGLDSFTYTLTDGTQTVTGTVTVVISTAGGLTFNIVGIVAEAGGNRVGGMGIPGRTYQWQYSSDLTNWSPLGGPVVCPANGVLSVLDPGPKLPPSRFYRLVETGTPQ